MKLLTQILSGVPEFPRLLAALDSGGCPAAVSGLSAVHRAHFAAGIWQQTGRPVVLLCADETEADRLAEDLTAFTGQAVRRLSARDFTFHNAAVVSRQWEHRRLSALRALAANGVPVNVTVVVPVCENRISDSSMVPGDVITSFSGKTIEILNSDAEGRLILADGLAWAAEREGCTHLVDIATLTGAVCAMLGFVTTGVMASDNGFYDCLLCAAERSGEKFWRMPDDAEYETLIESDYADVRNTSKDGCGAITAGLFLKKFTAGRPWLHLDIAGTADNTGIVWQHQVPGATGTAVSTLYHLAQILFETSEEEPA